MVLAHWFVLNVVFKLDLVCPSTSQSINFFPVQTQPLLSSSGGNGGDEDGNSENKRQSEVINILYLLFFVG